MRYTNPMVTILLAVAATAMADPSVPPLPERLSETGLYEAGRMEVRAGIESFSPQYPLWSDWATKRRWIYLPPGTAIDASNPDAWDFPPGTRLWKEFSHGQPVETRLIERLGDGSWRYATYVWQADGSDAVLAPEAGIPDLSRAAAPDGRYVIPSRDDCRACHEGNAVPVLGVGTLQLSPDRDPLAPRAEVPGSDHLDLRDLAARGLLVNLPADLLARPPRIDSASPIERAALGYLHANCGHCHNASGPMLVVDMVLAQDIGGSAKRVTGTLVGKRADARVREAVTRLVPGEPAASVLALRMRSRHPLLQMPPLGSRIADADGIRIVEQWILQIPQLAQELHQ